MYVPATPAAQPAAPPVQLGALASQTPGGAPTPPAPLATVPLAAAPTDTALSVRAARLNVLAGALATVRGRLRPALAGRRIVLQVRTRRGWRTVSSTQTGARGGYRLRYRTHAIGSAFVRVRFSGGAAARGSHRRLGDLNVYRLAEASWYGGGGGLACGGSLTSSTLGVANRTLPCGTLVTLRYDGRTVRVPVVDRGPYVLGREYDLTEATKRALGFEGVGEVWATR